MSVWRLAIVLLLTTAATAWAGEWPAGWRDATRAEKSRMLDQARRDGGAVGQALTVAADFDGDGRRDEAKILLNDKTGRFAVFVRREAGGSFVKLADGGQSSALWNYTLKLVEPGVHEPACARGAGRSGEPCRKTVRNRWPAIGLAAVEASFQMHFWDGRTFDHEFLSD